MAWFSDAALWLEIYFAIEWVIRVVMIGVVPLRRTPQAALAWLLVILLVPLPGLLLFWGFGRSALPRWRTDRLQAFRDAMTSCRERLMPGSFDDDHDLARNLAPTAQLAHNLGRFRVVGQNDVELLTDYRGTFECLIADIDAARHHVHVLYYIIKEDDATAGIFAALGRAVQRGVECRVLFDAVGSRPWARAAERKLRALGVRVHAILPFGLVGRRLTRVDLRNHRKIVVIDGQIGYVGSQNLIDSKFIEGLCYEELVARVRGPAARQLQYVFASDWYLDGDELLDDPRYFAAEPTSSDVSVQVLPSGPHSPRENNQRLIVSLVHAARKRIVVTTPYFVPDEPLLQALETAAARGVEVHLIVSRRTDNWLVRMAQESYYDELLDFGVHVHRYEPQFLHAKSLNVDGEVVLIGSSNMDIRSFRLNSEISMLVYDHEVARRLGEVEDRYLRDSRELVRERWVNIPYTRRLAQNVARLLSPLL